VTVLSLITVEQVEHEREVQQASMDAAVNLIGIAVGSMIDELKTLRMQLRHLQICQVKTDPLQANDAAKRGQKLYREAIDKMWADLPFRCADIVAAMDKDDRLANQEFVAGAVLNFVRAAKPVWFDWENKG